MEYKELVEQLQIARELLFSFQEKVLSIINFIRSESQYECMELMGWNRLSYRKPLDAQYFDMANGFEIPLYKIELEEGSWIRLETLQLMEPQPSIVFMFTYQKPGFADWPSWPTEQDVDWIKNLREESPLIKTNQCYDIKSSIFIAKKISIEFLKNEGEILKQLTEYDRLIINEVDKHCKVKLRNIFRKPI